MGEDRRKEDGRRVFSTEFKRQAVQRILSGEKTIAELSRELDIYPSVIRTWKRFAEAGATTAVQAREDVVPTKPTAGGLSQDPGARAGARPEDHGGRDPAGRPGDRKKHAVVAQRVRAVTHLPITGICQTLRMARRTAYYVVRARPDGRHQRTSDPAVLEQIRAPRAHARRR